MLERLLLYWSGDWELAEAAWAAARDRDARAGDRLDATLNAHWLGRVRRLHGAPDEAEAALTDGLQTALDGPQVPAEMLLRPELTILAAETGRPDAAREHLARYREILRGGEDWRGRAGRVDLAAAVLAGMHGRTGQAEARSPRPWRPSVPTTCLGRKPRLTACGLGRSRRTVPPRPPATCKPAPACTASSTQVLAGRRGPPGSPDRDRLSLLSTAGGAAVMPWGLQPAPVKGCSRSVGDRRRCAAGGREGTMQ